MLVDGARLIDVDASNQVILVARRQSGFGGIHVLTKVWLMVLVMIMNSNFCRHSNIGSQYSVSFLIYLLQISLMAPYEREDIRIPFCSNAVRDLHISPATQNLVLYSSLGKKLAVLR